MLDALRSSRRQEKGAPLLRIPLNADKRETGERKWASYTSKPTLLAMYQTGTNAMKFELTHKEDTSSHTWTCLSKPVLIGKENHRKDAGTWLSFVPSEPYCPQCGKRFEKFTRL